MPITQAKTARNAVAVVRGRDAIGMTVVPVGAGRHRAKVDAISAGHVMTIAEGRVMTIAEGHVMTIAEGRVMTIAEGRGTSEGAIRVAVNSIARKHRSWI